MNPLDAIKSLTNPVQPTTSYWECQGCGKTGTGSFPATCQCGARCWPGSTAEEAHQRVCRVKGIAPTESPATSQPESAPEKPVAPAPVPESPATTPAPVPAVESKRGRKKKDAEPTPAPVTEPPIPEQSVVPANVPVPEGGMEVVEQIDYAELRRAFVNKHQLTEVFKPVGEATIESIGFTIWVKQEEGQPNRPMFRWMEPSDTSESFKAEFNRAVQQFGSTQVRMDVYRAAHVSPPDLKRIGFQGELTLNRNAGDGSVYAVRGDRVRVGARLSKTGSIVFAALKNLTKENI